MAGGLVFCRSEDTLGLWAEGLVVLVQDLEGLTGTAWTTWRRWGQGTARGEGPDIVLLKLTEKLEFTIRNVLFAWGRKRSTAG